MRWEEWVGGWWVGEWVVVGWWVTIQRIMPLHGSILQVGTCQILSLVENPRWSRVWQQHCTNIGQILVKYWSNISQILHTYCQNIVNQFCFLQHQNTRNNRDSQKGEPTLMGGPTLRGGGAETWLF